MKKVNDLSFLSFLLVLTLLSSCTVRKAVDVVFSDVQLTKQLNPSKTVLSPVQHCEYSVNVELNDQTQLPGIDSPPDLLLLFSINLVPASGENEQYSFTNSYGSFISGKVPIYILYRSLKLWNQESLYI